ncbi:hypothetical protein [Propionivibrio sp.]|uniref:hypothetical protein n=1 Tax=Propionivibrio sp. TaxID=2212460 RepID=UPI002617EFA7|nr:hypothetical protein [Propionivibrio sp.]
MSSSAAVAELLAYGRERIARWRVAALVLGVAALACTAQAPRGPVDVLVRTTLAALLVATFRLWDDLADSDHDRARHPDRVLVRSARTRCFWFVLLALAGIALCAVGVFAGPTGLSLYAILILLLVFVYHGPWPRPARFMRDQLVLLKYPVFIAMLTTEGFSWRSTLFGAIAYLLVSVFDWRDDVALRVNGVGRRLGVVLAVAVVIFFSLAAGRG